jgi:hypothetical protein
MAILTQLVYVRGLPGIWRRDRATRALREAFEETDFLSSSLVDCMHQLLFNSTKKTSEERKKASLNSFIFFYLIRFFFFVAQTCNQSCSHKKALTRINQCTNTQWPDLNPLNSTTKVTKQAD